MRNMTKVLWLASVSVLALSASRPAAAQRPDPEIMKELKQDPKELLEVVQSYLSMVEQMRAATSDPLTALIIAQHDMKEILQKTGTPADAVKEFRRTLEGLEDPAARTAVRFAIADVYKAAGDMEKALVELRAIVDENKALLQANR